MSRREIPDVHPAVLGSHQHGAMSAIEANWAKRLELPIGREPPNKLPRAYVPDRWPMAGIGEGISVWGECGLTINRGATHFEPGVPRMCVEDFDQALSRDDEDGLSVPAEADGPVVSSVGTKKPERGGLL